MNKLLIKIPTRERGFDWLHHYLDNITNPNTEVIISMDDDNRQELPDKEWENNVHYIYGESKSKIHAINRDITFYLENIINADVILVGSDDMRPMVKGFDQIILDDMNKYYPDGDGCLWYHTEDHQTELRNRWGKRIPGGSELFYRLWICMLPIMGKTYYNRFGYVYHPSYKSFWCDNEQTAVAHRLGKIQYIDNQIITHMHPSWNSEGIADNLYIKNNKNFNADRNNFNQRKLRGFPIT